MSNQRREKRSIESWRNETIPRNTVTDVTLPISETYSGISLNIPIRVARGEHDGPTIFVTAACHGDELNGTGAIRQLISDESVQLIRGSLILVPILNLLGFDRHSRYLPDRRDLNRFFPGSSSGNGAERIANQLFCEIVERSDYGIDLHTAASGRTNYPNVRADLRNVDVRDLAIQFGSEVILNGPGPRKSLRREACNAGCPTIVVEGGETLKVEPAVSKTMVRGIKSVLRHFEMIEDYSDVPDIQIIVERAKWVRANRGGFLQFHVRPGQFVKHDQPLATNTDLLGREQGILVAPFDGVILGMTTLPAVSPGHPVCHVAELPPSTRPESLQKLRSNSDGIEGKSLEQLAANVTIVKPSE